MSDSRRMPKMKVDEYEKLDDIQKMYIKKIEKQNFSRAAQYMSVRSRKRKIGVLLAGFAVSVCILQLVS